MDLSQIIKHYRNCLSVLPDAPYMEIFLKGLIKVSGQLDSFLTLEHKTVFIIVQRRVFWGYRVVGRGRKYWINNTGRQKNLQDSMYEAGQVLYEPIFFK